MIGDTEYAKWSKENAHKYWVATEPCPYKFASSPWEGEFSYTSTGEYVQYRNGDWVKVNDAE